MENENEKIMRMEELESGQQEMREKIAQMMKMVMNLTKGKWITDDSDLQRRPTSWKDGIDPSIVPNPNDPCEQGRLREESSGQSKLVNIQRRCSLWTKS